MFVLFPAFALYLSSVVIQCHGQDEGEREKPFLHVETFHHARLADIALLGLCPLPMSRQVAALRGKEEGEDKDGGADKHDGGSG